MKAAKIRRAGDNLASRPYLRDLLKPISHPCARPRQAPRKGEAHFAQGLGRPRLSSSWRLELETAWEEFTRFLSGFELLGTAENLEVVLRRNFQPEEHRVTVSQGAIRIEAAEASGVRRALSWMQDEMRRRQGPFLPLGSHHGRALIRTRLSRCFFGPINRPPLNRDELNDDVDYYPEPYLQRLAQEGVNALWLTIRFQEAVPSRLFPDFAPQAERRLEKLRRTVARCARYGIRIFVFCIEPDSLPLNSPVFRQHPELKGHVIDFRAAFCTGTSLGRAYLEEAGETLFRLVPGLGGMIVIPVGERFTQCSSIALPESGRTTETCNCPRCAKKAPHEVLRQTLAALRRGMNRANRTAELIAWPYGQLIMWGEKLTVESARHVPPGVILQHNFETGGVNRQLGKARPLCNYWLSVVGPSAVFSKAARAARRNGTRMSAKLQVGCSHEDATVPFMPVPGLLYSKYRAMHQLGISSAMQCWYFGNYPSLMTRAAGRLSFAPFPRTEAAFLKELASRDWPQAHREVVTAWRLFRQAYENYPSTHFFGYYGPVQDGLSWPLYLIPRNLPLTPTWKNDYPVSGDYLADCLSNEFTLDEVVILSQRMAALWQKGLTHLEAAFAASERTAEQTQQWNVARAIGLQFASSAEILRFYQLRESLADGPGESRFSLLGEMEHLVRQEIQRRQIIIELCRAEPTLGFHSEAEGYKLTPTKIRRGIQALQRLLAKEFPLVRGALEKGQPLFSHYTGAHPTQLALRLPSSTRPPLWTRLSHLLSSSPDFRGRTITGTDWHRARTKTAPAAVRFCASSDQHGLNLRIELNIALSRKSSRPDRWTISVLTDLEPARLRPRRQFATDSRGVTSTIVDDGYLMPEQLPFEQTWIPRDLGWLVELRIPFQSASLPKGATRFRFNLRVLFFDQKTSERHELSWMRRSPLKPRQAWEDAHPGKDYGWVCLPAPH